MIWSHCWTCCHCWTCSQTSPRCRRCKWSKWLKHYKVEKVLLWKGFVFQALSLLGILLPRLVSDWWDSRSQHLATNPFSWVLVLMRYAWTSSESWWTKGLERSIQICKLAQSTAQETQTGIGIQHQKKQIKWWLFQPPNETYAKTIQQQKTHNCNSTLRLQKSEKDLYMKLLPRSFKLAPPSCHPKILRHGKTCPECLRTSPLTLALPTSVVPLAESDRRTSPASGVEGQNPLDKMKKHRTSEGTIELRMKSVFFQNCVR